MKYNKKYITIKCFIMLILMICITGCATPNTTDTPRNIIEQLLLSSATEQCFSTINLEKFAKKRVFVDYSNFATQTELKYAKGRFEFHLAKNNIIVVENQKDSEITFYLISGTLGTESSQFLIGLPSFPIPISDSTISITSPEIALLKRLDRSAVANFSLTACETKTQKHIVTYENKMSKAEYINYTVICIPFTSHNITFTDAKETHLEFDVI